MRGKKNVLGRLGRAIASRRRAAGLSQEELAHLSGLHRTYIGGVERGERNPTVLSLHAIARGLACSVAELFREAGL